MDRTLCEVCAERLAELEQTKFFVRTILGVDPAATFATRGHENNPDLEEVMNRADEGALAWALTDSAAAWLRPADRAWLCAKIVAGDQDSAIRDLLVFYANTDAKLPPELAAPILVWIQGYSGSDCEAILRRIYDRICLSDNASRQPPEPEAHRLTRRLIAKPSVHAARTRTATRPSTYAIKREQHSLPDKSARG